MKNPDQPTHIPVLLSESIEALSIRPDGTYLDGTLGGAGHAGAIAEKLSVKGTFIGCDVDSDAIHRAQERLAKLKCHKHFVHDNFRNLHIILERIGVKKLSGVLLDLGWSSFQIADSSRGLSFQHDGPLDMNLSKGMSGERLTAYEIVNFWEESTLADIFYGYGDETKARVIAKHLVSIRKEHPIATTHALADAVIDAIFAGKKKPKHFKVHPATKVFQALRIAVNDELQTITKGIEEALKFLEPGGRLAVITFHSGEDRIVKQLFKAIADDQVGKLITKKPIAPTRAEIIQNPRARSAKLRVLEKI